MFGKAGKSRLFIHQAKRIQVDCIDDAIISVASLNNVIVSPGFLAVPSSPSKKALVEIQVRPAEIT